jgi:adenylate kinase
MGISDEINYLKSLVSQLNEKIAGLEAKSGAPAPAKTPAQQLRTILMGPPGAGASYNPRFTRFLS